jgi:16S rRNA (cytidine1402-2'-O)-methyltransferase
MTEILKGVLYIVATPIGNPRDITLRALDVLGGVDAVICEEAKIGSSLLKSLGIQPKELILLNEHNESDQALQIMIRLQQGQSMALVSDCGTPVFADPGHYLIDQINMAGCRVIPVPGPSSLMAALSILNFKIEQFIFAGFLSRQPDQRRQELTRYKNLRLPVVVMDTPYRLQALLTDVSKTFGRGQVITLACDLSLPGETIFRGAVGDVLQQAGAARREFILIIH